ncbi:cytochrome c heme lyase subunit CcmL / Cytochrome c heme lyase subunit CcmH [Klebsiella michiganensis]|uniref:Cytochrome c heme lyase subunit CcmL / Cytochrome c heme lyase subunit CcmH n=1 Tax=Klebsiella michiganensis TaxID=1134687 RepID=A0A7H4PMW8_9ENTR|nr:cytochrome c heme lyase subunit CcmL / Cytochrome c heme lyase subunit CcmH [Klebsiella michiganensis]
MATQAYARAYALAPDNDSAAFGYAEALLRVSDRGAVRWCAS